VSERPNHKASRADFEFSALDAAVNFRAALLNEFTPWLKRRVVEVGAGIGQITSGINAIPTVEEVVAVEPEARFCQTFRKQHSQLKLVHGTASDLGEDFDWNALVCINVLEHIENDGDALKEFHRRLYRNRGHVCLFVPARQEIYSPIDRDFGHFRRYNKSRLRELFADASFDVIRLSYFNWVGYFAWWLNFQVFRKRHFDTASVTFFDRAIFPKVHWMERTILRPPFGQSLLAVARAR